MLLAAFDPALDARLLQSVAQILRDLADELFLVAARLLERSFDDAIAAGVQRFEAEILELRFHRMDAEAIGDRCVDFQRFARDRAPLRGRHGAERAHVVCTIGELDHDHADIAHHGEQHLAEGFRLRFGTTAELDLVELRDAIDQFGDFGSEPLRDFFLRGRGVLDHVVEDGRDDRLRIEVQVRQNVGDRHGMRDVGLTA